MENWCGNPREEGWEVSSLVAQKSEQGPAPTMEEAGKCLQDPVKVSWAVHSFASVDSFLH